MRDLNIQGYVIAVLCDLMLGRRSLFQRLHKPSLLWWEDYIITCCRKTPKENGSNRDILLRLLWSWSSSPIILPIDFELLVLPKHVGGSHTPSEWDELSECDRIEVLQVSPDQFRIQPNKTLSAESTASNLYAPGDIRTQICSFGSLFNFSIEADVDEVIFTATLEILNHAEDEAMPKVAYRAGPGGGQGVVLKLEPLPGIVNLTWGMWRSALLDITNYYGREGKVPIDFFIHYLIDLRAILIGNGSLVHDLWGEVDED